VKRFRTLLFTVVATTALVSNAHAFCRTMTCGKNCETDPDTRCPAGTPIRWPEACVSFSMQYQASQQVDLAAATTITEKAFAAWQDATCPGGGTPSIHFSNAFGVVACKTHEFNRLDGNANIVLFHDDVWVHDSDEDALAVTTVTFNARTGDIYDADIEIDGRITLSTDIAVQPIGFDLPSIITHEAGHFLGLGHSRNPGATMLPNYSPDAHDLDPDDVAGVCAIYPPNEDRGSCDFAPRQGFSPECGIYPSTRESCAIVGNFGGDASRRGGGGFLLLLASARGARLLTSRRKSATRNRVGASSTTAQRRQPT
jgi:Matrixin